MLLHELLDSVDVLELRGDPRTEIASVTHDSRAVAAGDLFCCVPGSTADGHDHAPAAVAAGAAALLVERPLGLPVAEVQVASVRAAMGPVAANAWGRPSTKLAVLGVTGTNGKTTTTYLLEAIARAAGIRARRDRHDRSPHRRRADPRRADDARGHRAAGPAGPHGRRRRRAGGHRGVVPRPGHAPGRRHPLRRRLLHQPLPRPPRLPRRPARTYFEAKALLFDPARTDAAATNLDDPHGVEIARRAEAAGLSVLGFGLEEPEAAVRAEALDAGPGGNRFRLVTPYGSADVHSPLVGRFNASNALAAAATALAAGLDVESVAAGLSAPVIVPGRMERIEAGQPFPVLVDYAHTPDGLEQVLRAARPLVGEDGRLVVVFGCGETATGPSGRPWARRPPRWPT